MSKNLDRNRSKRQRPRPNRQDNSLETLAVSENKILAIDQFMFANQQFLSKIAALGLEQVAEMYGGKVIYLPNGNYYVIRDLSLGAIVLLNQRFQIKPENLVDLAEEAKASKHLGHVFIDNRCLVLIDAEKIADNALLKEYQKLRHQGEDKPARDLLRSKGAAVRYGFNTLRDQLQVYQSEDNEIVVFCS